MPTPVYATLTEIAPYGATIRSLVLLEPGTLVEFDVGHAPGSPLTIVGRVATRDTTAVGQRFEYRLLFDRMASWQSDALARHVEHAQRGRTMQKAIADLPTTDAAPAPAPRKVTAIPVAFCVPQKAWSQGRITDISSAGMKMLCVDRLEIGEELDVRFTLPSHVLAVYPEETAVLDVSGPEPKRKARPDLRRPFIEMHLRGRVATRFSPVDEHEVLGVAFTGLDGYDREEIARFTHALQLARIRA